MGRFQVMAVLQAARAYLLGMPLDSAKSLGVSRAIFYAAARRGFNERRALPFDRTARRVIGGENLKVSGGSDTSCPCHAESLGLIPIAIHSPAESR